MLFATASPTTTSWRQPLPVDTAPRGHYNQSMGVSIRGRSALARTRFEPGSFHGYIPDEIGDRLAPTPQHGFRQRHDVDEEALADVLFGIVRGYETDPGLFDSWTGTGMPFFVGHVTKARGENNLLHGAFGLSWGLEGFLNVRDLAELAGAARMSLYGMTRAHLSPRETRFDPKRIPARGACADIEAEMLLLRKPSAKNFVPLLEGLETHQKYRAIEGMTPGFAQAYDFYDLAALMHTVGAEGLDPGRALYIWGLTMGTTGRNLDFVLQAVRSDLPDEYILELVEPQDAAEEGSW